MSRQYGTGHFWRCLALADALSHHQVSWEWVGEPEDWATEIIRQRGYTPKAGTYDLYVLDCLEVTQERVAAAHAQRTKVVVFEDEYRGGEHADLTVNELLDWGDLHGPRFAVFRPEFLGLSPLELKDRGTSVLVTFGGTNPSGLNEHMVRILGSLDVRVAKHGVSMAKQMRDVDLVLTSQGRTVGEAVMCGVPVVSIAQNDRETAHVRIPGVCYLGLHSAVTDHQVCCVVGKLLGDRVLRREMVDRARRHVDGRGVERIVWEIEGLLREL